MKFSLKWLFIFAPVAAWLHYSGGNPALVFTFSALAIIPSAGLMGEATEHLSSKVGPGIGGLLNATFGNMAELIIASMALHKGMVEVVKASLTGSIIGNLLLVMGASILCGGARYKTQRFNVQAARSMMTTLTLGSVALIIPTIFHFTAEKTQQWTPLLERRLSLFIALILFGSYLSLLWFTLKTHTRLFEGDAPGDVMDADAQAHGHAPWTMARCVWTLVGATAVVAVLSEFLVGSVEAARHAFGLTEVFVGVVVVAIIGNASEHSTAVLMALKNKMDLTASIAIGSSLQIAMFVCPVLLFLSYAFGRPMDLEFSLPEVAAVVASVHVTAQVCNDGESNWFEGLQMLGVYLVIGVLFFFLPETH